MFPISACAEEPLLLDSLNQAMAAKNNGGLVVVQARVRRFASHLGSEKIEKKVLKLQIKKKTHLSFLWSFDVFSWNH